MRLGRFGCRRRAYEMRREALSRSCAGWPLRLALSGIALGCLLAQQAPAQDRPSAIAPYRFTPAPAERLGSLEQQKAYSYRNQLSAQQRSMELDRVLVREPNANAASRLRSQGELSRESHRIDGVLQR
jgi:hypothetical protein